MTLSSTYYTPYMIPIVSIRVSIYLTRYSIYNPNPSLLFSYSQNPRLLLALY